MKILVSLFALVATSIALADVPRPAPSSSPKLTVITEGTFQTKLVLPKCATDPIRRCAAMPSVNLELSLPLVGCADSAFVTYNIDQNPRNSDVKVTVSALNVANPKSATTRCVTAPMAVKNIFLGGPNMQSKNVSVEFLKGIAQ